MDDIITITRSRPLVLMATCKKARKKMHLDQFPPIASLYRCKDCRVWWAQGQMPYQGEEYLLMRIVEPYGECFAWEDFRGWRYLPEEAHCCPDCEKPAKKPLFKLFETLDCKDY